MREFLALPSLFHSLSQETRASCPFSIGCTLFPQNNRGVPQIIPKLALSRQLTLRHLPFLPLFCHARQLMSRLFNRFRTLCQNTGGVSQSATHPRLARAPCLHVLTPRGHCIRSRTVEQSGL